MEQPKETKMIKNEDFKRETPAEVKEEKKEPVLKIKKFFFPQQGVSIEATTLAEAEEKLKKLISEK